MQFLKRNELYLSFVEPLFPLWNLYTSKSLLPCVLSFCFFNVNFLYVKFLIEMLVLEVPEECVLNKNLLANSLVDLGSI